MDINESIIAYLRLAITTAHIGEYVPQEVGTNYVWIQRQGDNLSEELNYPPQIASILFDVECVSRDIDQCRTLTSTAKDEFLSCPMYSLDFDISGTQIQKIQAFDVEDHGDDYTPHSIEQDESLHVGAFRVTAYLSDPITTTP